MEPSRAHRAHSKNAARAAAHRNIMPGRPKSFKTVARRRSDFPGFSGVPLDRSPRQRPRGHDLPRAPLRRFSGSFGLANALGMALKNACNVLMLKAYRQTTVSGKLGSFGHFFARGEIRSSSAILRPATQSGGLSNRLRAQHPLVSHATKIAIPNRNPRAERTPPSAQPPQAIHAEAFASRFSPISQASEDKPGEAASPGPRVSARFLGSGSRSGDWRSRGGGFGAKIFEAARTSLHVH